MADTELAKSLQEAKKKPRNFALIAKGPNVAHLVVQRKPIQPAVLQKLKQEHGGKTVVKGVVVGGDGAEMVFRLAEPAPVGEVKLRTYITDTAELHLKPRFEVYSPLTRVQMPPGNEFSDYVGPGTFTSFGWEVLVRNLRVGRHVITTVVTFGDGVTIPFHHDIIIVPRRHSEDDD